jgi:uncharacterized membrane protein YkoI
MKNKFIIALFATLLGGAGIVGSVVHAQNKTQPVAAVNQDQTADPADGNQSEADESKALQSQATITADQAKQIAETKTGGKATDATLGDENGTVVYEVTVGDQDVKVNAKDGSIVKIEKSDGETNDDTTSVDDVETNDDATN